MDINIYQNISGAKEAKGLTIIIDVFRAFTVECFLMSLGVKKIIPLADIETCLKLKKEHPDYFLIGERNGIKLSGFDCGNSPTDITTKYNLKNKTVVHSTSSGTQGLLNAKKASEVITGSFVNAKAISKYVINKNISEVSIVCMGLNGVEETQEDTLCAMYLKSLIEKKDIDIGKDLINLKNTSGKKFFDKKDEVSFPEPDFFMCITPNVFDFVLKLEIDENNMPYVTKIDII